MVLSYSISHHYIEIESSSFDSFSIANVMILCLFLLFMLEPTIIMIGSNSFVRDPNWVLYLYLVIWHSYSAYSFHIRSVRLILFSVLRRKWSRHIETTYLDLEVSLRFSAASMGKHGMAWILKDMNESFVVHAHMLCSSIFIDTVFIEKMTDWLTRKHFKYVRANHCPNSQCHSQCHSHSHHHSHHHSLVSIFTFILPGTHTHLLP